MDIRHLRLLFASALICGSLHAAPPTIIPSGRSVPGEVLVKFQSGTSDDDVSTAAHGLDADQSQRLSKLKTGSVWRIHSRSQNTDALTAALAHNPKVAYAEPNYVVGLSTSPNDTSYSLLWGLNNTGQVIGGIGGNSGSDIAAEAAWTITTGSASVVVGVVDTGIDYTHPDLAANVWSNPGGKGNVNCAAGTHGFNAITGTCDPMDDHYHGTHVSGTIGAVGNNSLGVVGVNWTTSLMGLKFIDSSGYGTTANAIVAIDFAVQAKIDGINVRVLSNSWGNGVFSKALLDEINKAGENDILFVASAGNDELNNDIYPHYPANYGTANEISVAATDNRDALAYFSDWGPTTVNLAAPGVNVYSCAPGGGYQYLSGTSMSTPHVSGVAALVLANSPNLTTAQVRSAILNNVDALPNLSGLMTTGGRLNAGRALGATIPPSFTLTASPSFIPLAQGNSTTASVTVNAKDGFTGSVDLSVSGLPTGVTGSFSPSSTATTSTLTLSASSSTPFGSSPFTITGTSGGMTRNTFATVSVTSVPATVPCGTITQATYAYLNQDPQALATGDFDGDGFVDVVAVMPNNELAILLAGSLGGFRSLTYISSPGGPLAVTVGDFNGDGKLDIANANSGTNNVTIRLGNGDGTFQAGVNYAAGASPFWIAAGDFNGDGKTDLAVANNGSSNVSILLGQGDGTFAAPVNYAAGAGPYWVSVGDFNGDGKQDLAVAAYNANKVSILLGVGDGTFQSAVSYTAGNGPSAIVVADFNGDGKQDLAVANYLSNNVSVLLGVGDGTFAAAIQNSVLSPTSIAVFDVDGDNKLDLAIGSPDTGNLTILKGGGDGTFSPFAVQNSYYRIPSFVTTADFNRDGKLDIVLADIYYGAVYVLTPGGVCSQNCGVLTTANNIAAGTLPQSIISGDFNGDGKPDVAVANGTANTVSVALGVGDATFQTATDYGAGTGPRSVKAADLNRDGKMDLIVADAGSNQVSVLLGNSGGTFQAATGYAAGTAPHSVVIGDFNRDGKLDVAVANSGSGNVSVLLGNGDGTFQTAVNHTAGTSPESIVAADFNRDGKLDLAVTNSGSNNVSVLLGNGDGTFQTATNFSCGTTPMGLVAADLNRDGKVDLAVANSGSNNVSVLLGLGTGSFGTAVNYAAGTAPYALAAGDFNKDGTPGLAVALHGDNNVAILAGNGSGTFGSAVPFGASSSPAALALADFNRDGNLDVVVANSGSNNFSVLLNSCPLADLAVTVTHTGTFTQGDSGKTFSVVVNNAGGAATSGTSAVTLTLSAGLTATAISGNGWTCTFSPLSCSRFDSLAAGGSFPTITVTTNVSNAAPASVSAAASVAGGGELNTSNDSSIDTVAVNAIVDLTVALTHGGSFTQGATGKNYFITVRNSGRASTGGTITVTDSLPAGLTATAMSGAGWNCTLGSLTCTRSDSLAGASNEPVITLTVNVATNAPPSLVNTVTVSGGGEAITGNDTASDTTVVWSSASCGGLNAPVSYASGAYANIIVKADFNHDGKTDLAITSSNSSTIMVLLGGANGTFGTPVSYQLPSSGGALAVADLNNDGNLDLIAVSYGYTTSIYVLLGNGDGTFGSPVTFPTTLSSYSTSSLITNDFNGDGKTDVMLGSGSHMFLLLGNGDGTLQNAVTLTPTAGSLSINSMTTADFNGDGIPDVVATDGSNGLVWFMKGNGDGTFQPGVSYISGYASSSVIAADLNGDGKLDLAVSRTYSYDVTVLLGNGDGTFGPAADYSVYYPIGIVAEDMNGDGKLDLVTSSYYGNGIAILLGNGDGTFQPAQLVNANIYSAGQLVVGDFNNDGSADVAVTNGNYPGAVVVMLGGCPDLTITKSHNGVFTAGTSGSYFITVTNNGAATTAPFTVTDTLPDGLAYSSMSGSSWNCSPTTPQCTSTQALPAGQSSSLVVYVAVSKTAPSTVVNQATVSGGGDRNSNNNTAYDQTTIVRQPDLAITMTHDGTFVAGDTGRKYTITVSNVGAGATSAPVSMIDNLPAGLTATAVAGLNWNCSLSPLYCTRGDSLPAGSAYPPITVTVNVSPFASSYVVNSAFVSGGGEPYSSGNNNANDPTTILIVPGGVTATALLATQVNVTWTLNYGNNTYQVLRSTDNVSFSPIATVNTFGNFGSYLDTSLTPNTAYFYKVRAVDVSAVGPLSTSDLAETVLFSSDPIIPNATPIRANDIIEMRNAINILRSAAHLSAVTFTDPSLSGQRVKAIHFSELETALNNARTALNLPPISFPSQPTGGMPVYGSLLTLIRSGVQ